MGGRNGGAMGKKKRNTEEDAKKNKVVTMPRTDGGKDVEGQEEGKKEPSAKKALRSAAKKVVKNDCGKLAGSWWIGQSRATCTARRCCWS